MHEWKVPSLEFNFFGGGPRAFQDKESGLFLFFAVLCEVLSTKTVLCILQIKM